MTQLTQLPSLPERPDDGHKGMFGRVLVVGGSDGMLGAPAFAAMAALRMGCGLAYVASRADLIPFIISIVPEAVGIPVTDRDESRYEAALKAADAVVAGPGLGQLEFGRDLLAKAVACEVPLLLDADGLNLIATGQVKLANRKPMTAVLTPHPGEMARLAKLFGRDTVPSDDAGRLEIAAAAAKHFNQIVVLKGTKTVITDGERYAINTTGDSTLSKAGSGDILSGMIGTLLAQMKDPLEAAWLGAHYHGKAGEWVGKRFTPRGALARDIIEAIPIVVAGTLRVPSA